MHGSCSLQIHHQLPPLKVKGSPKYTYLYSQPFSLIGLWWAYENGKPYSSPVAGPVNYVGLRDWSCQHDLVPTIYIYIYIPTHLNRGLPPSGCVCEFCLGEIRRKFFIPIFLIISYIFIYLSHISFFLLLFLSFRNLNST